MIRVLIAVNGFSETNIVRIREATRGWADCVRINQEAPAAEYHQQLSEADVLIGWPEPQWLLESPLLYFQLASVGYDSYLNLGLGEKQAFTACNIRGVPAIPVAEQVLAMMFCLARNLHCHAIDRTEKRWQRQLNYWEITGNTICIVGMGGIGSELARRCKAIGMNVVGVGRNPDAMPHELLTAAFAWDEMSKAFATADHVVLCFPATAEYQNMFNKELFGCMKAGACFYNVGRGSVVDETALADCLRSGHLRGAGLDVFQEEPLAQDHPFWGLSNVILTPHTGGRSIHEYERICGLFVENLHRFHHGLPLGNVIQL
ncbi:D-2-hydroxyacid dehydrogenase [Adhaeretor mobilis]|uniref:2-hydroxyacid dehydrogenase n=1 Tax=Adhaeretor mobilis TaxID=1930276 RepID=A0A517MVC5_9BACT|nr:D-2-hydroxyacid dehydrogenase [Adhaeretor mobilis]QDS98826.1 Putative 2-hydroxyacid dehydrogenase [Adhaeretor mobilis]